MIYKPRAPGTHQKLVDTYSQKAGVPSTRGALPGRSKYSAVWLGVACIVASLSGIEIYVPDMLMASGIERVNLSDGSTVVLNAKSEIFYESDSCSGLRNVTLSGEAFFNVPNGPSKALRVMAGNMVIATTGAAFDVKTADDEVVVTVLRGNVPVGDSMGFFGEVSANEQMVMNTSTGSIAWRKFGQGHPMFWETEILILGEASFREAMRRISRRFDVQIDITNPALDDCIIHVEILPGEDMQHILEVLSRSVNADVERVGDRVRITGGACR